METELASEAATAHTLEIEAELNSKFSITQSELAPLMGVTTQYLGSWIKQNKQLIKKSGKLHYLAFEGTRKFVLSKLSKYPSKVIALQTLKGGATKTTSCLNIGIRLNHFGARVLLIDTDSQGNLSNSLLQKGESIAEKLKIIDVATEDAKVQDLIIKIAPGLDLIPSDFDNSSIDLHLSNRVSLQTWFKKSIIDPIKDNYDFIIVDCNPSLSVINLSIAMGVDEIIIPVNPSEYSYAGMKATLDEYGNLERKFLDSKRSIKYNLLLTLYDQRAVASHHFLTKYATEFGDKMLPDYVRKTNDIDNSLINGTTAFELKKSFAREDYDALARTILGIRNFEKTPGDSRVVQN